MPKPCRIELETLSDGSFWKQQNLEVDGEQREEGTKGSKEQEIKCLGNVHLILDHLDRPPETLDRTSSSLFWISRSSQRCYRGFEGLLPRIDAIVIVKAGLLPLGQTHRGFVLVSDCLGKSIHQKTFNQVVKLRV